MSKTKYPRLAHFLVTWSLLLPKTTLGFTSREVNKTLNMEKERDALLEFKRGLKDDFGHLSTWGDDEDKKECCKWKGIEWDKRTGRVIVLDLHNEVSCPGRACFSPILTGKLSPSLLELQHLSYLDLSLNAFENSEILRFIGSFKRLQYLNLSSCYFSGEIPAQFQNLSSLRILDLGNNYLIVKDLVWLSHISSLEFLSLAGNDFQASNWFREITKVPSLKELDLSVGNKLTERIPAWIGTELIKLRILSLRFNKFYGSIPSIICQLQFLHILDLSANGLSGKIPQCLKKFTLLRQENGSGESMDFQVRYDYIPRSYLYIGDLLIQWKNQESEYRNPLLYLNWLECVGLVKQQLIRKNSIKHSIDISSYSGNAQLCGPPSPRIDRDSNTNSQEHDDDEDFPYLEFYISMVLGFIVAFWGFLGCLIVNRSWRNAYFTFLTDMNSWLYSTSRVCSARLKGMLRNY
ncbi:hypothetical protein RND71_012680 [Anisodus tanguticus]|uniref:Leucine-rich repeat-containing N-terminal plant-type domain-containing protein n=1 Tax=Anisodus tanguticus TaxID=243964 RepID=A0AAE1VG87_9SOLA|nr:hypothetical protein RND71_012680 [Anisodus tanguticus]